MPEVVNGCGTWYYGKKNLQQYQGVCRACGAVTTLSSYDTRLYVVIGFIAIIPLRAKPQDAELAKEALGACAGFRNLPAFLDLAPDIERHLGRDGETLRMLAAVHDLFGRIGDMERVLRMALGAQDEDETREVLAECLLRQGRPHEAQPLLQHVVERGIPDRVEGLYQLAQGFQIKGDH